MGELAMAKLFSIRSAHLPGNNWCQDWIQWMQNNHPLLALCCRHKLNPVGIRPRLVLLLSSVSFGLIATNIVYLFYRQNAGANGTLAEIEFGDDDAVDGKSFEITYEVIAAFILGGILHALTDLGMWHLTACACCLPGNGCHNRCGFLRYFGPYTAMAVAMSLTAGATFAVMMRISYEEGEKGNSFEPLSFSLAYLFELAMVYVCWFPMLSTFFFSGAIWPIFPCIGGRPKELKRQKDEAQRNAQNRVENVEEIV